MDCSARLPRSITSLRRFARSCSNCARMGAMSILLLPKPAGDVILRALVPRRLEQLGGWPKLDELPLGGLIGKHEGSVVRDACCLLHIVRNDDDGVLLRQLPH